MSLYAIILISSFLFPFLFSFERQISFYKYWNSLFPALLIIGTIFAGLDIYFTISGIWGFNPKYYSFLVWHLPIEEWLFFLVIPYASIFLHYTVLWLVPRFSLTPGITRIFSGIILFLMASVMFFYSHKTYTLFSAGAVFIATGIALLFQEGLLQRFFLTFLIILVPFCLVNAILTGSFIEKEVVWYNPSENMGLRLFTIPFEDIGYAFSLILLNLLLMSKISNLRNLNVFKS